MASRNFLLLGLLSALLLAGCVKIDFDQAVDRDGGSFITERIDMSALVAMSEQYGGDSDMSDICVNITSGQSGLGCEYDDGVVTVNKSIKPGEGKYTFTKTSELPYTVYTLEVRTLPELADPEELDSSGSAPGTAKDFKDPEAKTSAATLKTAGAAITYTVSMPGEIYSAEGGKIADGKAEFDVLDLMSEGEYIVVKSRELDLLVVGGAAVLLLAVIGGVAFFAIKRK